MTKTQLENLSWQLNYIAAATKGAHELCQGCEFWCLHEALTLVHEIARRCATAENHAALLKAEVERLAKEAP